MTTESALPTHDMDFIVIGSGNQCSLALPSRAVQSVDDAIARMAAFAPEREHFMTA